MDYEKEFDTKDYLSRYYSTLVGAEDEKVDNYYSHQFNKIFDFDYVQGDWLLDVGTGPVITTTLFSSRKFKNVVLSEYVSSNRLELVKWLRGDGDAFDWSGFVSLAARLESKSEELIEKRVKDAVRAVVPVDVNSQNPLGLNWFAKFDCILTSLCLEAACSDVKEFKQAIRNLKTSLKTNGHFIIGGVLNQSFYATGNCNWRTCKLQIEDIREALKENDFSIAYENVKILDRDDFSTSDCSSLCVIVAKLN